MTEGIARLGRALCIAALLLAAPGASAQYILDAVPGGLVEIPLATTDEARPEAYFGQRRILVTPFGRRWAGLVGLPLSMVPGTYVIQVKPADSETREDREFTVYPGRTDGRALVTLPGPPPDALQTEFEWREPLDAELPLNPPVFLAAQPTFGRYRQAADARPSYADFVVFNIVRETRVRTPDAGRIAAMAAHESGTYVWIDHGMSLYTRLGPLTDTTLSPSDPVAAGQSIGRVRLDEDETPQPLYLSVFLNGAAINPFLISEIEKAADGAATDRPGSSRLRQRRTEAGETTRHPPAGDDRSIRRLVIEPGGRSTRLVPGGTGAPMDIVLRRDARIGVQ